MDHIYIYAGSVSVAILMAKETTIFSWKSTFAMKWQHGHAEIHTLNRELSQKTCSIGPSSTGYGFGESWRCQRPSHCVSGNGELVVCPQLVNCGNPGSVVSTLAYFALFCHVHRVKYEDMPYSSRIDMLHPFAGLQTQRSWLQMSSLQWFVFSNSLLLSVLSTKQWRLPVRSSISIGRVEAWSLSTTSPCYPSFPPFCSLHFAGNHECHADIIWYIPIAILIILTICIYIYIVYCNRGSRSMIGDQVTFQCHTVLTQLLGMGQEHLPPKGMV